MFNNTFNTQVFNETNTPKVVTSDFGMVQFEDYDFTSFCKSGILGTIIQTDNDVHSLSNIDLETYVSSLVDGGGVINKKLGNKNISFNLYIEGEDYNDLILRIDTLKAKTQTVEGNLYMYVRGIYRTYTATIQNITVPPISSLRNFAEGVRVDILITSGYWYEKDSTSEVVDVTGGTEKIINNKGTYEAFPVISLACKSTGNAITELSIIIRKLGEISGSELIITQAITNNDLLVIDYQNKVVTLNEVEIQFFNPMTPLPVGNDIIEINPTGSANLEATISYNKTYL